MRGRKPKPIAIKKLAGNPGKRPLGDVPPPVPDYTPRVPRHLNEAGKREWRRMVKLLLELGLYTKMDRAALAMYCQAWGRWVEAEQMVMKSGEVLRSKKTGNFYQNPWFAVANRAWGQLQKMLSHFGLSPVERSRLKTVGTEETLSLAEILFQGAEDL
jgi:P27 family predicted phage terminase small subunit